MHQYVHFGGSKNDWFVLKSDEGMDCYTFLFFFKIHGTGIAFLDV